MLFNSIEFIIFLPLVFVLYWIIPTNRFRLQNLLLLISSYLFYGFWDYRFLFLLMFSTFLDYYTGLKMYSSKSSLQKKVWFWLSISINLGFLGFFKYYNFFIESFVDAASNFGFHSNIWSLKIILPVGISFYTFHGMSYVIDIYKERIKPTTDFIDYAVFVGFFPLLVAGPIERATHLLPQIQKKRAFNSIMATDGMRQALWGLFKKIVIADNCATNVNQIFSDADHLTGSTLAIGAVLFAFQIYCDFSGYSDIALGVAKLFGIDLLRNFAYPYFSRDIAEFWRRWHISLTTWFRDYVYIPLGGSRGSMLNVIRNTFIIFLISGLWHGANWTFILWGLLHAIYFIPQLILKTNRKNINIVAENRMLPSLKEVASMLVTFILVCFAWIFFRAESLSHAFHILSSIFSKTLFTKPRGVSFISLTFVTLLIVIEWVSRTKVHPLQFFETHSVKKRWLIYYSILIILFLFGGQQTEFIYFQF
jgi:alginate O-acetyltransferase complex protein AlgI